MTKTSLKQYRSHKTVSAMKIVNMAAAPLLSGCTLLFPASFPACIPGACPDTFSAAFSDAIVDTIAVSDEWVARHSAHIGGYFVRYADGYESFFPAKAFEEGYYCIEMHGAAVNGSAEGMPKNGMGAAGCDEPIGPSNTACDASPPTEKKWDEALKAMVDTAAVDSVASKIRAGMSLPLALMLLIALGDTDRKLTNPNATDPA